MKVSWKRYCSRRRLDLHDIVQQYGLTYEGLCTFFMKRDVTPPERTSPEALLVFGTPEVSKPKKNPIPRPVEDVVTAEPKVIKPRSPKFELSIKDTKARLLEVAGLVGVDASEKLTKQNILDVLSGSDRVTVKKVVTSRRKASKKKR